MIKTTTTLLRLSRPLIFALALMLIIGAGFPTPTRAQNDPNTTWYWATTPDGIVAYTLDGEANLLLTDAQLSHSWWGGFRTSSQSALLWNEQKFFLVSQNAVVQTYPMIPILLEYTARTYRHPYIILYSPEPALRGYVLNIETSDVRQLAGNEIYWKPVLLDDGKTLRYISYTQNSTNGVDLYSLQEMDLTTGQEKSLFSLETKTGYMPALIYTPDGEQWWMASDYDRELREFGTVQSYGPTIHEITDLTHLGNWLFNNDLFFVYDKACVTDCEIIVYPLDAIGIDSFTYQLPPSEFLPSDVHLFPDDTALYFAGPATKGGPIWLLETNGNNIQLGWFDPYVIGRLEYSEDGRWATALEVTENGEYLYVLWYLPYREPVYKAQLVRPWVQFQGDTVLIYERGQEYAVYWRGANQAVDLRNFPSNAFYIVGDEGKLLYEALEGGIYLFDPKTYTSTLLVPNGHACCDFYRTY